MASIGDVTAADNQINGETPPLKVAILAPVLSVYAAIDNGLEHVLAVSRFDHKLAGSVFGDIFPKVASFPLASVVGAVPDPERIISLQPDAVIVWQAQADVLRKIGYPGLIELTFSSSENVFDIWSRLGTIIGRAARASRLWSHAEKMQRELRDILPSNEHPTVLLMSSEGLRWWLGGKNYNLTKLVERVGAVNLASARLISGAVDVEEILYLNPAFILLPSFGNDITPNEIYQNQRLQALRAVHQHCVYLVPYYTILNVPVDELLSLTWLAEVFHPSLPHLTRTAYRKVYSKAYDRELSDDQIDAAVLMKENAGSSGYERFAR